MTSPARLAAARAERRQLQKQDQRDRKRGKGGILFVTSSLDIGGTERHLASICGILQARGWDLKVYCTGGEGPFAEVLRRNGVKVMVPPGAAGYRQGGVRGALRLPLTALHLFGVLVKGRFAIVHCFLPGA
ncbi:MAG: hypothetical protein JO052_04315, partial [Bradyrhizobium sp.]|nr:hypothetical protein [Bradyrhizobium sp.]